MLADLSPLLLAKIVSVQVPPSGRTETLPDRSCLFSAASTAILLRYH
jgi:hypothetical protein